LNLATALPLLLPRAIQWAEAQAQDALRIGRPLNSTEFDFARSVGVGHPEEIRIKTVEMLPAPSDPDLREAAIQAGLIGQGMIGLTLGYAVFICVGFESPRLLRHEFRHVYQYESAGSISAFLPVYLGQIVQVGYRNAPLEQDARAHE